MGNNYRVCGVNSPEPRTEVYCLRLNFNKIISKLVYSECFFLSRSILHVNEFLWKILIDLFHFTLQWTIVSEWGWGGHFHAYFMYLFVHPDLDSAALFVGIQEVSIRLPSKNAQGKLWGCASQFFSLQTFTSGLLYLVLFKNTDWNWCNFLIRCDTHTFHPTKSQKKVLKKMTKFLTVPKSGNLSVSPPTICLFFFFNLDNAVLLALFYIFVQY